MTRSDPPSNAPPAFSVTPRAKKIPTSEKPENLWLKLMGTVVLLLMITGATIWFIEIEAAKMAHGKSRVKAAPPPVFLELEPISVNLQPHDGKQIVQASFTVQLADQTQVPILKQYMPAARSRLLLLLSSKKASEISSMEGKRKLAEDALLLLNQPLNPSGIRQKIINIFLTSIVVH